MNDVTFEPETPFMEIDGNFVYCLHQDGWTKGKPLMVNDVSISVSSYSITPEQKKMITEYIRDCLNEKFPVKKNEIK